MRVLLLHLLHACILQLPWRMVGPPQTLTWVLTLPDNARDRLCCQPRYILNRKNCVFALFTLVICCLDASCSLAINFLTGTSGVTGTTGVSSKNPPQCFHTMPLCGAKFCTQSTRHDVATLQRLYLPCGSLCTAG